MGNIRRCIILVFLVWLVASSSFGIVAGSADPAENAKESSELSNPYWENVKSVINQLQVKFLPPDIDFRSIFAPSDKGINEEVKQHGAGATVKEAAEKSFQSSKKTVEETAKTAANVVGDAAHATAEKMKGKIFHDDDDADDSYHSEL